MKNTVRDTGKAKYGNNYKKDYSQQALVSRIKTSISTLIKNMEKIRYSMKIKDTLSKDKKTFS